MNNQHLQPHFHPQDRTCSFCYTPSLQIRLIIRSTIIRLKRMYQKRKFVDVVSSLEIDNEKAQIERLLRVLFDKNKFEMKMSKFCSHLKLQNLLLQKLKCKVYQLQSLIDQLCDNIARREYQLEIISIQIKNIQKSVMDHQELADCSQIRCKNPVESFQNPQKQISQYENEKQRVKIQEIEQIKLFQNAGTPTTGINYIPNFQNFACAYNFLFYEGPFYQ